MSRVTATIRRLAREADEAGDPRRTRAVHVGADALEALAAWLAERHPGSVHVVIADDTTWRVAGEQVEASLRDAGLTTHRLVLEPRPGDDHLVCEDGAIESLRTYLGAYDRLNPVAVGAGTLNDIVKKAAHQLGRPYQVVPTAASMNGYTSTVAATLSTGVKRTTPCRQPEAVFADVEVVRRAPATMNRAGFGDLTSKPWAHVDWLLSHHVRGVPYHPEATHLLDEAWETTLARASGVGHGDPEAIEVLMETLLLSGFSMARAGTSSPASGSEHLISHYWDMEQLGLGQPLRALHGIQVGIGTRLSARLIERLVGLDAEAIDPDAAARRRPDPSWLEPPQGGGPDPMEAAHPHLLAEVREEMRSELRAKQRHGTELRDELAALRDDWPRIRDELRALLVPTARLDEALHAAGCPGRASELGVDRAHLERTLRVCRHLRSRYVALDLLDDLGLLDGLASEVAAEVEGADRASGATDGGGETG